MWLALALDGTESAAEVFGAIVAEWKGPMFILLGAVFTFTIAVVLIKRGLRLALNSVGGVADDGGRWRHAKDAGVGDWMDGLSKADRYAALDDDDRYRERESRRRSGL